MSVLLEESPQPGSARGNPSQAMSLADADVQQCPDAYHEALRERPVHFDERLGFFVCGRYALMREVLRDTETFSSIDSQSVDGLRPPPPEAIEIRKTCHPVVNTLVTNDPPSHTRIRKMVDAPFRARSLDKLKSRIEEIAHGAIDEFIGEEGACEMVSRFAVPIPVRVIADMLGLDPALAPRIKAWSDASVDPLGMMAGDQRLIECAKLIKEFQDFIVKALEARRAQPQDDLLTHLVQARDAQGEGFTMAEMLSLTQQLLVAGNETTTNGIAAGVRLLAEQPTLLRAIRRQPSVALIFVNEVLRLESPVQGLFRVVRKDTELGGVHLPKGARIMLRFAAANRDGRKYANPERIDLHRANAGTHVAFGAGIHHCIGAGLARLEMREAFTALAQRLRRLELAPDNDFAHHPSMILRGLQVLRVTFERA